MKRIVYVLILLLAAISAYSATPKYATALLEKAQSTFDAGKYKESIPLYLQADSAYLAEGLGNSAAYGDVLENTGRAYMYTYDMLTSRGYFLKAMQVKEKAVGKVNCDYIKSLNSYAQTFFHNNEFSDALAHNLEVIALCQQLKTPEPKEGLYLTNLAKTYRALNDEANAVKYMEAALLKVEKFGSEYEELLQALAEIYDQNNDIANFNRILGLVEEHNENEIAHLGSTVDDHLKAAEFYLYKENSIKAKDEFLAAFALPMTDEQKIDAYYNYASFLTLENDYEQAAEYYDLAASICEKVKGINNISALMRYFAACCYFQTDMYAKAMDLFKLVDEQTDTYGLSALLKTFYLPQLSFGYIVNKNYGDAKREMYRWLDLLVQMESINKSEYANATQVVNSLNLEELMYEPLVEYAKTVNKSCQATVFRLITLNETEDYIPNLMNTCVYALQEKTDENESSSSKDVNRQIIQETLDNMDKAGDYLEEWSKIRNLSLLANCYNNLGEISNAVDCYSKYLKALKPAIANLFLLQSPKERTVLWQAERANLHNLETMLEYEITDLNLLQAINKLIYDKELISKSVLLNSNIEFEKVLNLKGSKEMQAQYAAIRKNLEEIERMRERHQSMDEILALERKTDAMQLELARQTAQLSDFMNFVNISAEDVLNALEDDAIAIEFFTYELDSSLPDMSMIIANVLCKEYPNGLLLPIGQVGDFKTMLADAEGIYTNDEYGYAVWGRILQSVPGKHKIYFAPDGILNVVPIEYLSVNGKTLSEQYYVSRLSSTRELVREHRPISLNYAALFGNINYYREGFTVTDKTLYAVRGTDFNNLTESKREIDEINKMLEKHKVKSFPYEGEGANKAEFISQQTVPVNILHIATHGCYDDQSATTEADAMEKSMLAFAGASLNDEGEKIGLVNAAEIAGMVLQDCDLVVLSACRSGLGKISDDGVFGLQRGFKNAGAKTLIVSLNDVYDATTADMMIAFYDHLLNEGLTVREAFNRAQADTRAKHPDDNTWASFVVIDAFN